MVTPFKVLFRQPEYHSDDKEIFIMNFVTDEQELYRLPDKGIPEVIENKRLTLEFVCEDNSARFYMDGLDTIPMRFLDVGEDDVAFLPPSNLPVLLYDSKSDSNTNPDGFYPFIPGYYRIKVIVNGVSYYSWLKVKPKQITEEQWVSMREEIEESLHGLAQDLVRKNASLGINSSIPIPIHILRKLIIIKKDFSKWMVALKSIESDPRMRIRKEYHLVPEGKAGEVDATSIQYRVRHPESQNYFYSPKNTRNYNLVENQWIKKIFRFIVREMNALLDYLEKHKEKVCQEIKREQQFHHNEHVQVRTKMKVLDELIEYERFVRRIRGESLIVLGTEWLEEVDEKHLMSIPHVMHLDARYRYLYQMYRVLKNQEFSISLDTSYDFYWKRTDLLYEIWGFLQLTDGLQHESVGFEVIKGWIFDVNPNSKSFQVPFLEPGTMVEFKKDDICLSLVYDERLPFKKEDTIFTKPVYTNGSNNRPDVRLDLYKLDEYIGTIMIDFKYRPLWYIWDNNKLQFNRQTDTMRQLISYRNNIDSTFLYRKKYPGQWHRYRPVHEVWAVYPKHDDYIVTKNPMESHRIRLMELTPMVEKDAFYKGLAESIQKVIDSYNGVF
jgi:hypothetical protein